MRFLSILLFIVMSSVSGYGQIDTAEFNNYQQKFHHYRITNAEHYVSKLDSLTKPYEVSELRYRYYNILGGWYTSKRNNSKMFAAHTGALKIATKLGSAESMISSRFNLASGLGNGGDLKKAMKEFEELDEIIKTTGKGQKIRLALYGNRSIYLLNLNNIPKTYAYNDLMKNVIKSYSDSVRYHIVKLVIPEMDKKYKEKILVGESTLKMLRARDLFNKSKFNVYLGFAYLGDGQKEKEQTIVQQKKTNLLHREQMKIEKRRKNTLGVLLCVSMFLNCFAIYIIKRVQTTREEVTRQRNKIGEYAKRLEESNKMRDKLFAMLSHDLRSPVSNLVNTLEVIKSKGDYSFVKVERSLSNIQLILNNVLKWSGLQLNDGKPYFTNVDLYVLINSILNQTRAQVENKDIKMVCLFKHTRKAWADENYLQIILRNIISNAAKFTPEEGYIRIDTKDIDSGVQVIIRDSGVGISADKLKTIFSYPASSNGTEGEKGAGLGLTLCKELLDKIEGEVGVKSKVGVGTEISIYLQERIEGQNRVRSENEH